MRFGTLAAGDPDSGHVVLLDGEAAYDLTAAGAAAETGLAPRSMLDLVALGAPRAQELAERLRPAAVPRPLGEIRLGPPVPRPGKVIAAPINYVDHQREMNQLHTVSGLGIFLKAPTSVIGPGEVIRLPYTDRRFDQEGELAAVIGAVAKDLPLDHWASVVFGYTCLLDITMRGGEDRSTRKSFDTFSPIGPCIVTADEIGDPAALELTCTVNGRVRQHASTADLIWGVPQLVEYASSVMTLLPGDIITTGTPAGVGPIEDGDRIEVTISRIGTLTVGVSAHGARNCPTLGAEHGPVAPPARPEAAR
jgi:2-keto-4-pentenoate hydratase/2-oxohepta-3-ene-1,7-dioic acid hydratase in catechol pathway